MGNTLALVSTISFRFKFKALELNRKILEAAVVPKKPVAKEVTQPEGFQLEIEKRLQERQSSKKPVETEDYTFHPKPLPLKILEEVVVCIMHFSVSDCHCISSKTMAPFASF